MEEILSIIRIVLIVVSAAFGLISAYFWFETANLLWLRPRLRWLKQNPNGVRRPNEKLIAGRYPKASVAANALAAKYNGLAAMATAVSVILSAIASLL